MDAVHRGSRFAQVRLCMHLVLPTKAADPYRIALRKGWECCSLVRRLWGEELFSRIWALTARDGPLLSFKKLLAEHGIEHSFMAGGPEWSAKHPAQERLDAALEQTDLAWVGRRRKGLTDAANIDVKATRALADRMEAGGLREAYQSAIVGDMVVRISPSTGSTTTAPACAASRPRRCSTSGGTAPGTRETGWAMAAPHGRLARAAALAAGPACTEAGQPPIYRRARPIRPPRPWRPQVMQPFFRRRVCLHSDPDRLRRRPSSWLDLQERSGCECCLTKLGRLIGTLKAPFGPRARSLRGKPGACRSLSLMAAPSAVRGRALSRRS